EPYGDSSSLPTFALSALARGSVTVALSGDGGDESFLGYSRYLGMQVSRAIDAVPLSIRRAVARASGAMRDDESSAARGRWRRLMAAGALDRSDRYARWMSHFNAAEKAALCTPEFRVRVGATDPLAEIRDAIDKAPARNPVE